MNRTVQLGELVEIRQGYSTRKALKAAADGSHFILQMRDFDDDRARVFAAGLVRFSPGAVDPENELKPYDLVFLAKGVRNFAFAPSDLPPHTLAANYFFILRPTGVASADYIVWFLNRPTTRDDLTRLSGGGVHTPVIRKAVLAGMEIPLPPAETQRAIVQLDALARHEQQLHTQLTERRRTLFDAICIDAAKTSNQQETTV